MIDLDDIIEFENESNWLDFKAIEYVKNKHAALLKDVIALANSTSESDRFIIIGVKINGGSRDFRGIEKLSDDASYQELIHANIEPEITVSYMPHVFKGKTFGVFRISHCNDKPYLMKKDFQQLKMGEGFIRKGSAQKRLSRKDLDRIYTEKHNKNQFDGKISIKFLDNGNETIKYPHLKGIKLPSEIEKEEIEAELKKRKTDPVIVPFYDKLQYSILGVKVPYSHVPTQELKAKLENLEQELSFDDKHAIFEVNGTKLNFIVSNAGNSYLEDASLFITIPKQDGLLIAKERYRYSDNPLVPNMRPILDRYPKVEELEDKYLIRTCIGNLKHQMQTHLFDEPLNIIFSSIMAGVQIPIIVDVFGKNMPTMIRHILTIEIVPPVE